MSRESNASLPGNGSKKSCVRCCREDDDCKCSSDQVDGYLKLQVCRSSVCDAYEDGDRCILLSRPCQLPNRLNRGKLCPIGHHTRP